MSFVRHDACPKCGSRDNLGVYKDGHQWCFGCGYYKSGYQRISDRIETGQLSRIQEFSNGSCSSIPSDSDRNIGVESLRWIKQYGITNEEIEKNHILWSESKEQLIFPIYGGEGELLSWQARNFKEGSKLKYFTSGRIDEVLHILSHEESDKIVVVEDMISAIKVSRHGTSMPLFGSHISPSRLNRLRLSFNGLVVWLDRDKAKEAYKASSRASLMGFKTKVIVTDKDPKELSDLEIERELNNGN